MEYVCVINQIIYHNCLILEVLHETLVEHRTPEYTIEHGLINYKDTKTKCRRLKKLTCKGTSRQVFIRVYRLETVRYVGISD